MARSTKRSSGGSAARSSGSRSTSRKSPARPAELEIVEEKPGFGLEEGVIFITTLVLVIAFVMIDRARGGYGEGMFFK